MALTALTAHADAQEKSALLPCTDPSPQCVQQLGDLAIAGNLEIRTLDRAIEYQRRRMWSSWLNADGFNPISAGLRVIRNVVGGGDRAAVKLEIARLEQRRASLEDALRQSVAGALADLDSARRRHEDARVRLRNHEARRQFMLIGYRLGEGSTEHLLQIWQREDVLRTETVTTTALLDQGLLKLRALLVPQD
ncbi:MAG: hypothetical protein KF868_17010 [Acidobacteria bacterium]|nr:hypothetical protein [Acidobacteriota bacterium]MCW5968638.1 hypothetical protein [Blastocatellales bacterium]